MAAWRIARAVKGKCHRAGIAGFVKPTVHQAVTTNYTNRPRLVWSTARCASSETIRLHHVVPTVECNADGRKLKVSWPDGVQNIFHSVWLRHSCTCSACWDVPTNQKLVRSPDLIGDPKIHSTEVCESQDGTGSLNIRWSYSNGGDHQGKIDLAWLRKNCYSLATIRERQQSSTPVATTTLPRLSCSEVLKGDEGVWKWMRLLSENGVCLLTDVSTQLGQIKKVTEKAKLLPREVFSGLLYDVISVDKPTDPANNSEALPLHMDLTYFESPPGLQFLHCIRNDACVEGGESVLLDAFAVVEEMRVKHPQHFATLTRVPATFEKAHRMEGNPVHFRYQRPHISVDRYSKKVTGIFWNPIMEGALFVPEEDVEVYYEAYLCLAMMLAESDLKIYHRLEPGEAITLNNRRFLHSRTAFQTNGGKRHLQIYHGLEPGEAITFNNRRFLHSRTAFKTNGGKRHLQGVDMNTEDFKSWVHVLAFQFSPGYEVKTVFDEDMI